MLAYKLWGPWWLNTSVAPSSRGIRIPLASLNILIPSLETYLRNGCMKSCLWSFGAIWGWAADSITSWPSYSSLFVTQDSFLQCLAHLTTVIGLSLSLVFVLPCFLEGWVYASFIYLCVPCVSAYGSYPVSIWGEFLTQEESSECMIALVIGTPFALT